MNSESSQKPKSNIVKTLTPYQPGHPKKDLARNDHIYLLIGTWLFSKLGACKLPDRENQNQ
jgi:hypothetical protein